LVTSETGREFAKTEHAKGRGVYIFAISQRGPGAPIPWYVGKTELQDFASEAFTGDKLRKYALASLRSDGSPYLYLIEFVGHGKAAPRFIDDLETLFVLLARNVNPDLLNVQKALTPVGRLLDMKHVAITGVINSSGPGRRSDAAAELLSLLRLEA